MRVRTDVFAATFEELRDFEVPIEGPADTYPTVESVDLDVAVMWELARILIDVDLDEFLRDTHLVTGPDSAGELDKPTVELFPGALIDALLSIGAEDVVWVAERWASVPDWRDQHSASDLTFLLVALAHLASHAMDEEKLLFLWTHVAEDESDDPAIIE